MKRWDTSDNNHYNGWQIVSGKQEGRNPDGSDRMLTVEELLSQTISVALNLKVISKKALETVVVDSTVQPKAIARPTDSRLLEVARQKLVAVAKDAGISLKQTFAKEGKQLTRKAGGYAHAIQFRRMRKTINRPRHRRRNEYFWDDDIHERSPRG